MKDNLRSIGHGGEAGRGSKAANPSAAARSLAGPRKKAPAKKALAKKAPAKKTAADQTAAETPTSEQTPIKKTAAAKAPAKKAAAKKAAATKAPAKKTPAKKTSAKKTSAAPTDETTRSSAPTSQQSNTSQSSAQTPETASAKKPRAAHVRVVTDEELAAAAQAAEDAAKASQEARARADEAIAGGLPIDEVFSAVVDGAQRLLGEDWQQRFAQLSSIVLKRLSGHYEVDEFGLDPDVAAAFYKIIEPIAEAWFRLEVRGVENIPTEGGALLVGNHSGTIPVDGLVTGYAVQKHTGRPLRSLGADLVFQLPLVGLVARKVGATLACTEDAERLLTTGELAAVYPEGFKGVGKPFSERYKLQRFGRGGFVSSAMRAQVPIIPVSIVGAEEIYPIVGNVSSLARLLGFPYLPITPFFPLLGPLGLIPLPSKWIIEFGEPIRTDAYPPEAADDPMLLFNVTDQVRETIQQTLYQLLVERGHPFF